jgi:ferredoxin
MSRLKYLLVSIVCTLFRFLPFPAKTGLIKIGNPNRDSPVFISCNYALTIQRVTQALKGIDAYLLAANSRGINVWCAAGGGHFTHHDVISALKTSGIEELVDHRRAILPQLAATGVEAAKVRDKTGWRITWGPVYIKDISSFIENDFEKDARMSRVEFPWPERLEMAIAWAFPVSLVFALLTAIFWRSAVWDAIVLVWAAGLVIFLGFPLYSRSFASERKRIFDFGHGGFQLILWAVIISALSVSQFFAGGLSWCYILRWSLLSIAVILVLNLDLLGSTPIFKSSTREDRFFQVILDADKCRGAGFCEAVCPRNCFAVDKNRRAAEIQKADLCIRCGACIVQCPLDALSFQTPQGEMILPETVRKFKLNLLGKRIEKAK